MTDFFAPSNQQNGFRAVQQFLGGGSTASNAFVTDQVPSVSGLGTRQSRLMPNRPAINTRNMMYWLVPEQPIIEMYVNPQNVTYSHKKTISSQRVKGGFLLQYWGEDLSTLRISGTTGTSGIEGINVLMDVYRNEQLAMDPYALFLASQQEQISLESLGSDIGSSIGGELGGFIGSVAGSLLQSGMHAATPPKPAPSLAQLAFTVELYWSGEVYRGYFTSFNVTERADNLGLFDYDMEFVVTQKRGFRQNFLAWHRSPTHGPSNSNPQYGTPHSFGSLVSGVQRIPQRANNNPDILETIEDIVGF